MNPNFWGDGSGADSLGVMGMGDAHFNGLPPERQGSLSQAQQLELMGVLEDEGMTDIDTYLNMGLNFPNDLSNGAGIQWNGSS